MFVDRATIRVRAGAGGNGAVSFHREKYVPAGGPDGGDGGRGGDIIVKTDANMSTLMDFRYKRKYAASNGADGGSKGYTGKDGESLVIRFSSTLIRDKETAPSSRTTGVTPLFWPGAGGWGTGISPPDAPAALQKAASR